jgi:hypothetical protein
MAMQASRPEPLHASPTCLPKWRWGRVDSALDRAGVSSGPLVANGNPLACPSAAVVFCFRLPCMSARFAAVVLGVRVSLLA